MKHLLSMVFIIIFLFFLYHYVKWFFLFFFFVSDNWYFYERLDSSSAVLKSNLKTFGKIKFRWETKYLAESVLE